LRFPQGLCGEKSLSIKTDLGFGLIIFGACFFLLPRFDSEKVNPSFNLGKENLCIIQVTNISKVYGISRPFSRGLSRKNRPFEAILCRQRKKIPQFSADKYLILHI
jgi:hypothetical protein